MTPLYWPVYGHCPRETVAVFFDWGDAASFAMRPADFGGEQRNLYVGTSRQRPVHILQLEARRNDDGSYSVAA
jgi:hypothetical protein